MISVNRVRQSQSVAQVELNALRSALKTLRRRVRISRQLGLGLDAPADRRHRRDGCVEVGVETDADSGDDRGAERAKFGDGRKLERQVDRGGEDLEPRTAAGRSAGEARRARPRAAHEQMIDMAAVLERHALIHGADHFRQAVPGRKPDEARSRFGLGCVTVS